ncbi:MAG TPA: Druantia anti-phage system protein DruA [Steroidobacteraceae bacterium]|nr:Druantia anti-phage system protein DruA [Steroidobacteraceae bacterium]
MDDTVLRYRGRTITAAQVVQIQALVAAQPEASRRALSRQVCELWQWRQPNGVLRDIVCRGLLVALHRAGHLVLPPVRARVPPPASTRRPPPVIAVDTTPLHASLRALRPLEFRQVRRTPEEAVCNSLLAQYHYLGYVRPIGEHLKYMVYAQGRPIACFVWSSAPRHLGPRDRFIGWTPEVRRRHLHLIAYNPRYLILPWVHVPHLASHLLGRMATILFHDWPRVYGHPIYFLETFVDPTRFRGTCYRAANWRVLGRTTGRGKWDLTHRPNRPIKDVLGYPLTPHFRQLLAAE